MDKDQVKGSAKQAEGHVEETAGKAVGDEEMETDGKAKKTTGKVQSRFEDFKSKTKKSK